MADSYSFPENEYILIGKVIKPHGLRGEIRIIPFSKQPEAICEYSTLVLVDTKGRVSQDLKVKKSRVAGNHAVIHLAGVNNRNQAEEVSSAGVLIHKKDLPQLKKDEFYYYQLMGLSVTTKDGTKLGVVINVFSNGAQDIMEIEGENQNYLIPILKDVIVSQDEHSITITPPPGLLDVDFS